MNEQLQTLEQPQSVEQANVDAHFDIITDAYYEQAIAMIELNYLLSEGLQSDKIATLKAQRDISLAEFLERPAEAIEREFTLLSQLYEGRTLQTVDTLGTVVNEFVTRDETRTKADLHFRELQYESGNSERIIEVPYEDGDGQSFFIGLRDDELRIVCSVWRRGEYQRIEIDMKSSKGQELLEKFSTHSITASDLVYNRDPAEIAATDRQAMNFLYAKKRSY